MIRFLVAIFAIALLVVAEADACGRGRAGRRGGGGDSQACGAGGCGGGASQACAGGSCGVQYVPVQAGPGRIQYVPVNATGVQCENGVCTIPQFQFQPAPPPPAAIPRQQVSVETPVKTSVCQCGDGCQCINCPCNDLVKSVRQADAVAQLVNSVKTQASTDLAQAVNRELAQRRPRVILAMDLD